MAGFKSRNAANWIKNKNNYVNIKCSISNNLQFVVFTEVFIWKAFAAVFSGNFLGQKAYTPHTFRCPLTHFFSCSKLEGYNPFSRATFNDTTANKLKRLCYSVKLTAAELPGLNAAGVLKNCEMHVPEATGTPENDVTKEEHGSHLRVWPRSRHWFRAYRDHNARAYPLITAIIKLGGATRVLQLI